ncbi:methyltransferase-like protein 27 isoform X2 [Mercenaria mercenaria]|uniref:methyltransferase-like protein 27 isoform X2 n=1 Tax=Mercenaria mercenaria TaxID=6596 RepID=UPI00234E72FA|nr:methyltransferase-like protein 27 isoform X2 [Mercenaria mercenaria]
MSNRSGDERDEVEEKKTREFMAKYMANYRAHRKGMSPLEVADYYSHWAENMKYDEDLNSGTYNGPTIIADEVADCFPENRDKIKIIDIACGTGRVGDELAVYGFKLIDGLDPSDGMLKQCRNKGLYKNLYKEFCCDKTLPIEEDVYDCLVVSGGMGESHIPCSGILEMIRIVKPGGLILIVMRKEYLKYVGEYVDRLEPFFAKLERENKMEMIERREVTNYSFDRDGVVFKIKVKKSVI